jgi:transposase
MENAKIGEFAACVGIDWADKEHEVRMLEVESGKRESLTLKQEPEAVASWVQGLRERFGGRRIAVALEQRKGALIHALMGYEILVLYPVNPKTVAKIREAFYTSGSKSDPVDAELLLDIVTQHRDKLRAWVPDKARTRLLQALVEERRNLVDEKTRLKNRLRSTLKEYFPQALEWVGELDSIQAMDFLGKWPTLESVQRAKTETVRKFFAEHGHRNLDRIEGRVKAIEAAKELTKDFAIVTAGKMKVQTVVAQMRPLVKWIAEYNQQIAELFESHPDREVFSSFPCAKDVLAPRLLVAFGEDRSRYDDALEIQSFSGIAPVTKKSGQSRVVEKRLACPKFVRQTFQEYAAQSIKKRGWARNYYLRLRARGVKHYAAVRAVAYKWIRIMYRCWQEQAPYSEEQYMQSLIRAGSPLASGLCLATAV